MEKNKVNTEIEEVVEEVITNDADSACVERSYSLRKLKDGDLFPLLKILRKIGLHNFKDTLSQLSAGKSVEEIGILVLIDMAEMIIGNLDKAEEDIYAFYSELSGLKPDEIREMEFGTLPLMIYDSFSGVKNTSFFKVLSKLL